MKPFILTAILTALFSAVAMAQAPGRQKRTVTDEEVMRVHRSTILIDTHNDVTSFTVDGMDIGKCASSEGWHDQWESAPPG
jgi:hypothetical protein